MKRCSEQLQMVTSKINYGFRSIKNSKVSMIKIVIMMKWREQFRSHGTQKYLWAVLRLCESDLIIVRLK